MQRRGGTCAVHDAPTRVHIGARRCITPALGHDDLHDDGNDTLSAPVLEVSGGAMRRRTHAATSPPRCTAAALVRSDGVRRMARLGSRRARCRAGESHAAVSDAIVTTVHNEQRYCESEHDTMHRERRDRDEVDESVTHADARVNRHGADYSAALAVRKDGLGVPAEVTPYSVTPRASLMRRNTGRLTQRSQSLPVSHTLSQRSTSQPAWLQSAADAEKVCTEWYHPFHMPTTPLAACRLSSEEQKRDSGSVAAARSLRMTPLPTRMCHRSDCSLLDPGRTVRAKSVRDRKTKRMRTATIPSAPTKSTAPPPRCVWRPAAA